MISTTIHTLPPAVEPLDGDGEQPILKTIPFAVALPSSLYGQSQTQNGIVGSIVRMGGKSAMIWVGWGLLDQTTTGGGDGGGDDNDDDDSSPRDKFKSGFGFGTGTPTMGQLVVAMPRTDYKGAFSGTTREASCSQLVGSASSEDQMLANQMASRLSSRSGMAIYVSCQLSSPVGGSGGAGGSAMGGDLGAGGHEADMLSQRAAALAEREVWRILQRERERERERERGHDSEQTA